LDFERSFFTAVTERVVSIVAASQQLWNLIEA
jgi:hypothetical protein